MPPLSELPNVDWRLPISRNSFPGFLLSWEILTETKMPDVDLAITSGIWLFLQADQCGVARNARLTPVESIDRPAISPASLMSLACSSRAV
jgi:hypothetical protein